MSDAKETSLNKEMENAKPNVDQGKNSEASPSAPTGKAVTIDAADDNQRKMLEAMFELNRIKICQQMMNIYNS